MKRQNVKFNTLEEVFYYGSQSAYFKGTYEVKSEKLKIEIRKDSYKRQSYARVYVWNITNQQWNFVDNIIADKMQTVIKDISIFKEQARITDKLHFRSDINGLKDRALNILF